MIEAKNERRGVDVSATGPADPQGTDDAEDPVTGHVPD